MLNGLDRFVIGFLEVFTKHSTYVIISGYVSILLGRSRISEDVDLLFPALSKEQFLALHNDLVQRSYWCLKADSPDELYDLLATKHSIRYGENNNPFPNMEIKFVKNKVDQIALSTSVRVVLPRKKEIHISNLELQVAYKEEALGSKKDCEDAQHIREVLREHINEEQVSRYKQLIRGL